MKTFCKIIAAAAVAVALCAEGDTFSSTLIIKGAAIAAVVIIGAIAEARGNKEEGRA